MKDVLFWALVCLAAWAPLFTAGYYANGGSEARLHSDIQGMREAKNKATRFFGSVLWLFLDQGNRWLISGGGAIILFTFKLAGVL